jgi:RNA polymerase sigma-70 factor, ECF subfamily
MSNNNVLTVASSPVMPACHDEFEVVYQEYYKLIYRYILYLIGGNRQYAQEAEDLTQDTFTKAFKAFEKMDNHSKVSAWLYRIATNTAYDALRRRRLVKWYSIDMPFDEESEGCENNNWILLLSSGEDNDPQQRYKGPGEALEAALAQLPAHYRQPLLLSEMGYEYPAIAQALNISKSALRMRIMRARNRLEQLYNEADRREVAAQATPQQQRLRFVSRAADNDQEDTKTEGQQ